jgi:hypothetical protein
MYDAVRGRPEHWSQYVHCTDGEIPKYSVKIQSQCHSVHHEPHMDRPWIDSGPPWLVAGDQPPEPWHGQCQRLTAWVMARPLKATDRLSHGTANAGDWSLEAWYDQCRRLIAWPMLWPMPATGCLSHGTANAGDWPPEPWHSQCRRLTTWTMARPMSATDRPNHGTAS